MPVIPGGLEWLTMLILFSVVPAMLFWRIFRRAGLPPVLGLIALMPVWGQVALLCVLVFADWPALQDDGGHGSTHETDRNTTQYSNREREN